MRQRHPDSAYIMLNDQLLGDALEVSLTHLLESIPNLFLDEFFCFWGFLLSIFGPIFSRMPVGSDL